MRCNNRIKANMRTIEGKLEPRSSSHFHCYFVTEFVVTPLKIVFLIHSSIRNHATRSKRKQKICQPKSKAMMTRKRKKFVENLFDVIGDRKKNDGEIYHEVSGMLYGEDLNSRLDLDCIDHRTDEGYTPLIASVVHFTQLTLFFGCEGCNVNYQDNNGMTAFQHACIKGRVRVMEFISWRKVETTIRDNYGRTPMHCFCEAKGWCIERCTSDNWLMEPNSSDSSDFQIFLRNMGRLCFHDKNLDGQNPLHVLCQNHNY